MLSLSWIWSSRFFYQFSILMSVRFINFFDLSCWGRFLFFWRILRRLVTSVFSVFFFMPKICMTTILKRMCWFYICLSLMWYMNSVSLLWFLVVIIVSLLIGFHWPISNYNWSNIYSRLNRVNYSKPEHTNNKGKSNTGPFHLFLLTGKRNQVFIPPLDSKKVCLPIIKLYFGNHTVPRVNHSYM